MGIELTIVVSNMNKSFADLKYRHWLPLKYFPPLRPVAEESTAYPKNKKKSPALLFIIALYIGYVVCEAVNPVYRAWNDQVQAL
jgi:hypothetical protein